MSTDTSITTDEINKLDGDEYWDEIERLIGTRAKSEEYLKMASEVNDYQDKAVEFAKSYCLEFSKKRKQLTDFLQEGLEQANEISTSDIVEGLHHEEGYDLWLRLRCNEE